MRELIRVHQRNALLFSQQKGAAFIRVIEGDFKFFGDGATVIEQNIALRKHHIVLQCAASRADPDSDRADAFK